MNTTPAASKGLYVAAGAMITSGFVLSVKVDLGGNWKLAVLAFFLIVFGAIVGGLGAVIHDQVKFDAEGRDYPAPDPARQYVFNGREP